MIPPTEKQPALSISGLTTAFKVRGVWAPVLHGIKLDIPAGETIAVVGESGSGKSVTALSVMRLLDGRTARVSGSVRFGGADLLALPEHAMEAIRGNQIAMIFQEPMTSLNPVQTIGQQIVESLKIHRGMDGAAARAEAVRLLERVRIPAAAYRFDSYPHHFSGGMRQRVMIALALACGPKLLIADEPTTALDVTIQAQILELIKTLQREEGMSVMFITHDMGVVAEISDRTVVMYRGEVVEHGPTADIFRSPADAYTRRLLSAVPRLGSMNGIVGPRRFDIGEVAPGAQPIAPASVEAMQKARPILEVTGLTKRFPVRSGLFGSLVGRVHAVEDVSFAVEPGETLSLVGESGCGKSTTGRAVMRLIDADTGSVLFDDQDVLKLSGAMLRRMRRGIQMVFQDPFASLNPRMTVGRAITEPLRAHGLSSRRAARDRAVALLEQVGLQADMVTRYPHEFSGGQRQRICIARAISLEPKLVVADESVSALDVSVKAQVVNLLMDLQARLGISYLFISHDMAVVERISHKVAVMYLGEIVEFGRREDIFGNPQHPYTKRLLAAVPVPDPARRSMYRPISNDELRNPLRPVDYTPPDRRYRSAGAGHRVLEWGAEWGG